MKRTNFHVWWTREERESKESSCVVSAFRLCDYNSSLLHHYALGFPFCTAVPVKIMDEEIKEERPNLCKLLEEQLPEFGLDVETYGPYVVNSEADEVSDVVELLKASSEKEDAGDVWENFTEEILNSLQLDEDYQSVKKEEKKRVAHKKEQERAEKSKAAIGSSSSQKLTTKNSSQVDDVQKKRLMQRFGYENPEEDGDRPAVVSNKQAAAAAHMEKAKELRSKKSQTKKEEQQKTKENRASKSQLKEERRKKALKGERKR
jgi:hypothetical protein